MQKAIDLFKLKRLDFKIQSFLVYRCSTPWLELVELLVVPELVELVWELELVLLCSSLDSLVLWLEDSELDSEVELEDDWL